MIGILWANKWGRYGICALAVLLVVASVLGYYYAKGKQAGKLDATSSQALDNQRDLARERASTVAVAQVATQRETAAKVEAAAAGTRAEQKIKRARAQDAKLQQAAVDVANTPDPMVHAALAAKLGRPADKVAEPGFTATEERTLLLAVNQLDAYFVKVQEFSDAVDELKTQVLKLQEAQLAAGERERKKDVYLAKLEPAYVQAFNALQQQRRRSAWTVLCLRICGKPKKIDVPDLDVLRGPP